MEVEELPGDREWGSGSDPWAGATGRVGAWVHRWGGVATTGQLMETVGRREFEAAVASGVLHRVARGRWVLESTLAETGRAHALSGVLSHSSAARRHGWSVLSVDERVHVTVRRGSRARADLDLSLHWADLGADDLTGDVTARDRTLVDCMRGLPLREALAITDSALRDGYCPEALNRLAAGMAGRGAARARRVASEASGLADNPFESALRAVSLDVPGMRLAPQVSIHGADGTFLGRADLVDERLGLVVEADSFAWHGSRDGLVRDARRYNQMALAGWTVLRFTWEDVVLRPGLVANTLTTAVKRRPKVA